MNNQFVFLLPTKQHLGPEELEPHARSERLSLRDYQTKYRTFINLAIDERYRKKGFTINHIVTKNDAVSELITVHPTDNVLSASLTHEEMAELERHNKEYHVNTQEILIQLHIDSTFNRASTHRGGQIIVGGFFWSDCVDFFAKEAYAAGLNVLVDEDLTDLFPYRLKRPEFKIGTYPSYDPTELGDMYSAFLENRKDSPWLWKYK